MNLVQQHIIKKGHKFYKECDNLTFRAKNLYNQALYRIRQLFIKTGEIISFPELRKQLASENQVDFRAMSSQVSKEVLRKLDKNWKSFFAANKAYKKEPSKFKASPKLPTYKHKTKGRFIAEFYNPEAISKKWLRQGIIKLSGTSIVLTTKLKKIKQVRIIPKFNCFVIEVVYQVADVPIKPFNGQVASIDLGVNNLAAIAFNTGDKPLIINGKPLKSINQYYNKTKAKLMSYIGDKGTSRRIEKLTLKRNNKVKDYIHKSTTLLANHIASQDITKTIIGWNIGIKQEVNIGKKNNQNFVNLPLYKFVQTLSYKLKLKGVDVIEQEESYTSKCSFLDNETIQKHEIYKGKRIKRGLFKSANGTKINADINAAYNIGRKAVPNAYRADGIEVLPLTPIKMNNLYKKI